MPLNRRRSGVLLLALACITSGPLSIVARADGPNGIAFVEAPERSGGHCVGKTPDQAFACARAKCAVDGVQATECLRRAWCYPAGWSVDVFVQHKEGPHWHEFSCGWDSREAAARAAELKCDQAARPYLMECTAVRFFDPAGNELRP